VDPVLAPTHAAGWKAITGGVVVRDPALTSLVGRYLYADFYVGQIRDAELATPVSDDRIESALPRVPQLVAFGEDADAHVYVVSLAGSVQRIVEAPPGDTGPPPADPPPATQPTDTTRAPLPDPAPTNPVPRDTTAPLLRIRAARVQDVLRRGVARLSVTCNEPCLVRTSGLARGLTLRGSLKRLAPGKRVVLELRLSRRVRRALAQRGTVAISLRGRDAAGNLRAATLTVAVKRR
jgi:hypothetical protein